MSEIIRLEHSEINARAHSASIAVEEIQRTNQLRQVLAYPVPRGGVPAALAIRVHCPDLLLVDDPHSAHVAIDDLIDSGATAREMLEDYNLPTIALVDKREEYTGRWIVFPWENEDENAGPENNVRRLLQYIGEDPDRPGLLETPGRYLRALKEWSNGYQDVDLQRLLKVFEDGAEGTDEMVVVRDIPFHSLCEHHIAPFFGTAKIAYIPNGKIVGLSKLPRLLRHFSARLQVQERLTIQVVDALMEHLDPIGAAVQLEGRHMCMEMRGVRCPGAVTTTRALRGAFREQAATREEFLTS